MGRICLLISETEQVTSIRLGSRLSSFSIPQGMASASHHPLTVQFLCIVTVAYGLRAYAIGFLATAVVLRMSTYRAPPVS